MSARFWQLLSSILFIILIILGVAFFTQKQNAAWQERFSEVQANQTTLRALAYQQGSFDTLSQIVTITAQCRTLPVRLGNLSVTLLAAECLQQGPQGNTTQ